jgi:hypothetical protein
MKHVTLADFLTDEEIKKAMDIWDTDRAHFHRRVLEEIIRPNLDRINVALGQDNDPSFLAYAVEAVFMKAAP